MIEQKEINENKGIRNSLIKSYEILEEKFNQNEEKINKLKAELNGEHQKKKKRKNFDLGLKQNIPRE